MCWYVYIATPEPLKDVVFTEPFGGNQPPPLHFEEVSHDPELRDNLVRPLFSAGHLYYVGSSSGCSCHLVPNTVYFSDGTIEYEYDDSAHVFLEFIKHRARLQPLEMYAVWEDAWDEGNAAEPLERVQIEVSDMTIDQYFRFESRRFYVFTATPKE